MASAVTFFSPTGGDEDEVHSHFGLAAGKGGVQ
jgi:hypothetical protein